MDRSSNTWRQTHIPDSPTPYTADGLRCHQPGAEMLRFSFTSSFPAPSPPRPQWRRMVLLLRSQRLELTPCHAFIVCVMGCVFWRGWSAGRKAMLLGRSSKPAAAGKRQRDQARLNEVYVMDQTLAQRVAICNHYHPLQPPSSISTPH